MQQNWSIANGRIKSSGHFEPVPAVILLNRPIDGSARGLDRALATAEEVARREGADTVALRSVRAATSVDDLPISKSRS